ncbi:MAG: hypothetical protein Q9184_004861, partial [Pyrenodesmia sp. 2 TL-2023]
GGFELRELHKRVNEHAYKAWVKTFDESDCLRKRNIDGPDQQGFDIGTRIKVSLGLSMGMWIIAVVVSGLDYLRWFGVALLVEVVVRWAVEWMWWNTRVKRWVKRPAHTLCPAAMKMTSYLTVLDNYNYRLGNRDTDDMATGSKVRCDPSRRQRPPQQTSQKHLPPPSPMMTTIPIHTKATSQRRSGLQHHRPSGARRWDSAPKMPLVLFVFATFTAAPYDGPGTLKKERYYSKHEQLVHIITINVFQDHFANGSADCICSVHPMLDQEVNSNRGWCVSSIRYHNLMGREHAKFLRVQKRSRKISDHVDAFFNTVWTFRKKNDKCETMIDKMPPCVKKRPHGPPEGLCRMVAEYIQRMTGFHMAAEFSNDAA